MASTNAERVAEAYAMLAEQIRETTTSWQGSDGSCARLAAAHDDLAHHVAVARAHLAAQGAISHEVARVLVREAYASAESLLATAHEIGFEELDQSDALLPVIASAARLTDAMAPYLAADERREISTTTSSRRAISPWELSDAPPPRTFAEFARAIAARGVLARSLAIDLFVGWLLAAPADRPIDAALALLERRAGFDHADDRETSRALRVQLCAAIRQIRNATGRRELLQAPCPLDLAAMPAGAIVERAIDPLRGRVDFHASWTAFHVSFAEVTPAQRGYFAISWTVYEVEHGGFWQYFLNSTGMLAPIALEGMRLVGATAAADVLARAMATFPGGPSPERADRIDAIEHVIDGALDRLNLEFYAAVPDLMRRLKQYALAHPHELFELAN